MLLKCARDMVRGKGDAIGGNIVSLERFGFSAPWKMSLVLYHGKSGAATHQQLFLGTWWGEEKKIKSRSVTVWLSQYFGAVCCELL